MKEKFDRNKHRSRRYVMHCRTEKEFINFLKYLDSLGEKWGEENNSLLQLFDIWHNFKERTVFYFNSGNAGVGSVNTAKESGYIVLEYDNFDFSKEKPMEFNINAYDINTCMHCKTEEEARDFCNYLHSLGKKWGSGCSYSEGTRFERYGKDTVYYFTNGSFADLEYARMVSSKILKWSDFMKKEFTKADLKTGDVIKRRNGDVEIFNLELGMFIRSDGGWNELDCINNDLSNSASKAYDIIAVRRPITKADCSFRAFTNNYGTLIYERKEVEEMTLEQVCKLLGKEIKIIK